MKITWLGHAGFRIETGKTVLLLDPWLRGNPSFGEARFNEAIEGATHMLVTHAHPDHAADVPEIASKTGAMIAGIVEYANWFAKEHGGRSVGFNLGGTIAVGDFHVTMVSAQHSSSLSSSVSTAAIGRAVSYMISAEGTTLYAMGDTDVHADMALHQELHEPDIALVPIGGLFTMDAKRAAFACKKFFKLKTAIPIHYGTLPILAESADEFVSLMEGTGTKVRVLEVMVPAEL